MFSKESVREFWDKRTLAVRCDPCHYMNKVMDQYIFKKRTRALKKLKPLFKAARKIIDLGCGAGTYTEWIAAQTKAHVIGIDRAAFLPDVLTLANYQPGQITSGHDGQTSYYVRGADIVTLLTVYDYLPLEFRLSLRNTLSCMQQGSYVFLIDINKESIQSYQQNLDYKLIETRGRKIADFYNAGFDLWEEIPIDYLDSRVFHWFGRNIFAQKLSYLLDWLVAGLIKPNYTILVFRKVK